MTARIAPLVLVVIGIAAASACRARVAPATPRADLIVLLADPEDGGLGAATVTTPGGRVELTRAGDATRVVAGRAPGTPARMPNDEIQRRFGEAMASRPPAPRKFLLYFETGGDSLTAESRALVPEIVTFVRNRPSPDVTVIGHTDTTDDATSNINLGMRRAYLVRDFLVNAGLDASQLDTASHGEADLLVPTPDNTPEAKNRRVEVTVR